MLNKTFLTICSITIFLVYSCGSKQELEPVNPPVVAPPVIKPEEPVALSTLILKNTDLVKSIVEDVSVTNFDGLKENYISYINKEDKPIALYILQIDLNRPDLSIAVGTPNNQNTSNSVQRVSAMITSRNNANDGKKVLAGINGDYFDTATGTPLGPVHKNKTQIKTFMSTGYKFFGFLENGNYIVGNYTDYLTYQSKLHEVMGGRHLLLDNGVIVTQTDVTVNPRTTIGLIDYKTAVIMVVDGRQATHSVGFTLTESAKVLKALGVKNAVNLDGGGSTVLLTKDKTTDTYKVKNKFSDGSERAVANALFILKKD